VLTVLREAFAGWQRHRTAHLAAALSFYLAFSLAPLLGIAVAIGGLVLGPRAATQEILGPLTDYVGPSGARFLSRLVLGLSQPSHNVITATIGTIVLFVGASAAFATLSDTLNIVLDSPRRTGGIWQLVQVRAMAFVIALAVGLLLLAAQIVNAAFAVNAGLVQQGAQPHALGPVGAASSAVFTLELMTALFAALFYYVPDARVSGREALVGGFVTALLFMLGQWVLSLYIRHSAFSSIHGAAAAALIIMTWLYYSSQVVFFGAEFTRAYAQARAQVSLPVAKDEPATG